ncbi:flagellar hook-associated protein FlgL [Franzmannia qiaohouensis]|uniref:Flagellar hook-associated protein FlgL n=1 Tax=Franzmannia qiaohouensis TaxID=1329370 RepID=A0ABU1HHL5_9GAMM|nr:flagellar hook-associated protein FlgL [Halomonas qiaohouensis]MDR5906060.1 flagellar hook-associated protein FlgL [Halomonas qiaohouensis]
MRVSTVTMFEQSVSSMNRQQNDFMKVGQQIASGRRVVNPSDDPQAASRAVGVAQSKAVTQQHMDARVSARNSLSQEESILNSVSDAIASAKTLMIQASSDTLSDVDRQSIASELRGIYETVIGQANATDGNGRYLFGGYQDSSPPYVREADGSVSYVGDNNVREQRIDSSRLLPVTDNGNKIFASVPSGAKYITEMGDNQGSLIVTGPTVVDSSDPGYGQQYRIEFSGDGEDATYTVETFDTATQQWVALDPAEDYQDVDYVAGEQIRFGGLSLTLNGTAADGDGFTLGRATQMEPNLFRTFENALAVLEQPAETPQQKAALRNTLNTSMRELDNSLDNVLTVRASVGARLNEIDVVDSVGGNRMLNYEQTLSDLIDLDYAEAISEYSLRQVGLQAAQKAFVDIQGMSLFDRL